MTVDRDALIEATATVYVGYDEALLRHARPLVAAVLDQALPLIADAIATSRIEMYDEATPGTVTYDFAVNVKSKAARLVRSLLGTDSDR